jgi:tellurite resistance protein TehA-like permease
LYYKQEIDSPKGYWAVTFPRVCKMTEKGQTSQGYIIRILQHFATKLWNITNFVMLFQAVMTFLSRLV